MLCRPIALALGNQSHRNARIDTGATVCRMCKTVSAADSSRRLVCIVSSVFSTGSGAVIRCPVNLLLPQAQ